MAQKTWVANDILTASDINTYASREGGAFTTWTPAVVQSGSVTVTVNEATYARAGRKIDFWLTVTMTGTGTSSNVVTVSLPVTAKAGYSSASIFGTGRLYDLSATSSNHGLITFASTTTVKLKDIGSTADSFLGQAASNFSAALASGDYITLQGSYEAAS